MATAKELSASNNVDNTVVGPSILISGRLTGDEDLTVRGRVEGELTLSRTLIVEPSGVVKANVAVKNAIVSGVVVGIPAGTWLGGKLMGGQGTFLATAGGSLVGWGGALLGSALLGIGDDDQGGAVALLLLPVVGAVAGYELSSPSEEERPALTRKASTSTFQVVPIAGMSERGPRLGFAGRF
ncbi:polymer-forming cytoskeletal protein [Myxococcus sp. 1LA]